jgi:hypothetical protein
VTTPGKPVFGAGVLRYPQVMSPNFNLANPAASPANSWALLQNGLAYIFGLILSGGTITGPDYIINTSGIFIYSGAPAHGNLIGSWAGAAGTDGFGNAYPQGFNVTQGAISGTTFSGTDFIINSAGAFFYSGTPAAGNLFNAIASAAGTDAFGNAYLAGDWSYPVPGVTPAEFAGAWQGQFRFGNGATAANMGTLAAVDTGTASLVSPVLSGTDTAGSLSLVSHDKTGLGYAVLLVATLNPTWLAAQNPNTGNPETWHPATVVNGWASSSLKYKLLPTNAVHIVGDLDPAASTSTTFFTLPAGYRPNTTQDFPVGFHNAVLANVGVFGRVSGGAGTLAAINSPVPSANGQIVINAILPLDY